MLVKNQGFLKNQPNLPTLILKVCDFCALSNLKMDLFWITFIKLLFNEVYDITNYSVALF